MEKGGKGGQEGGETARSGKTGRSRRNGKLRRVSWLYLAAMAKRGVGTRSGTGAGNVGDGVKSGSIYPG